MSKSVFRQLTFLVFITIATSTTAFAQLGGLGGLGDKLKKKTPNLLGSKAPIYYEFARCQMGRRI